MDGAKPHTAAATKELYSLYQVPVVISSPYSFDAAPCELFFAQFKRVDINESRLPVGKR